MNLRMHQLVTASLICAIAGAVFWLGNETRWGDALTLRPMLPKIPPAQPIDANLLPDYKLIAGTQTADTAFMQIQERTLFTPSRALAPPPAAPEQPKPTMRKGQFVLTGAIVAGDSKIAYLRELATNKTHNLRIGEAVNGVSIASIEPRKVVLKQFEDSEELSLNIGQAAKFAPAPQQVATATPGFPQLPPGANPQGVFPPGFAPGQPASGVNPSVQPAIGPQGGAYNAGAPIPPPPIYPQQAVPAPGAQPGAVGVQPPATDDSPRRRRMWQNAQ